jgi:hypothetical protein
MSDKKVSWADMADEDDLIVQVKDLKQSVTKHGIKVKFVPPHLRPIDKTVKPTHTK